MEDNDKDWNMDLMTWLLAIGISIVFWIIIIFALLALPGEGQV